MFVSLNFVLLLFVAITRSQSDPSRDPSDDQSSSPLWSNLSQFSINWAEDFSARNKPIVEELIKSCENVSQSCVNSLMITMESISRFEYWSIQMINSWANFPPSGLFDGSLTDFGSYDQCLGVDDNPFIGSAQYCSISFVPPLPRPMPKQQNLFHRIPNLLSAQVFQNKTNPLIKIANESSVFYWVSLRTAVCLPDRCSQSDINSLANTVSKKLGLELKSVKCETKSNLRITKIQSFAIIFILIFVILCTIATLLETKFNFEKNTFGFKFVELFSIRRSVGRLLAPNSSKDLSCIHGIRVLSIVWIIYGHSIQWSSFQSYAGSFSGKDLLTTFMAQPFLNGEYGVVTFLLISGILTTYITFCVTKFETKKFDIILFIIFRLIRLLPQLMIFILLTFLLPLTGSGPLWEEVVGTNVRNCHNNWWLNLFLVHNIFRSEQMCAIHSWFIALDFQFHILSAILIILFLCNFKFGLIVNVLTAAIFLVISLTLYYKYELPPALINTGRTEHFDKYYSFGFHKMPVSYGAVFFVGTLVGCLIYKKSKFNISRNLLVIIWSVILLSLCIPLWDKVYWNYGRPYTQLEGTLLYNTNQMVWTVCVSAMIWLCISGNGSVINRILSLKIFVPMARLTYSVYLCHAWLIWYYFGSRRHLMDINVYNIVINFIHIIIMSYIFGFIFYLLFESPILESQKYLFKWLKNRSKDNKSVNEVEIRLNIKTTN